MAGDAYHVFNDLEGLRIAAEIERRGADFYQRAMRLSRDPDVRGMLARLAEEEQLHASMFDSLYQQAVRRHENSVGPANYGVESSAFLSALAADVVFPGGLTALARSHGLDDPSAVLSEGIKSEKDAILYYTECMNHTRDEAARAAFEEIIAQERDHLVDLQSRLVKLDAQGAQSD